MENLMSYLRRKQKIEYDMNCIKKYIKGGDYDKDLQLAWEKYERELADIHEALNAYIKPNVSEILLKKMQLEDEIRDHKNIIKSLREQVDYLDSLMSEVDG